MCPNKLTGAYYIGKVFEGNCRKKSLWHTTLLPQASLVSNIY